ncbi:hypothetical protein GCM10010123_08970 [Pilimelia anulata]|uniref:Neutral metalloproteinase n=1 Tax=Pilimelia anulata TaxID=53371 RepID=A0A8J3B7S7_9ACTN|nr:M4 family metallopeptidase [Pilimelia anulata]GGJ81375.1 hypothetical protein GCM10010123_08970 [Pilimelia anulata]
MQKNISVALGAAVIVVLATAVVVPVSIAASDSVAERAANRANARVATARFAADSLVAAEPTRFHLGPADAVGEPSVVLQDDLQYVAYTRTHKGMPVWGGDFVVVTDSSGAVRSTSVAQRLSLDAPTAPRISAVDATAVARRRFSRVDAVESANLLVVAAGRGRLAYEVVLSGVADGEGGPRPSRQHVFVDATSGRPVRGMSYDDVREATGKGFYYGDVDLPVKETLVDTTRQGIQCGGQDGSPMRVSGGSIGTGSGTDLPTACVDAMYAAGKEWDMLKAWLGRDGIDGKGRGFPIRVGLNQVNAFWNGQFTNFGHSSDNKRQLTVIDIVGHEFGHGIFQNTPGGSGGGNEAGGLNESTGDIFGALTEFFANDSRDKPDYDVGELGNLSGRGPIRVMSDPSRVGDPNCFSSKIPNTEVHAAAGPQNHWFYLLAEGSNPTSGQPKSPTCDNSTVTGIGIQKAGKIFMGALNRKTSGWNHAKARAASVAAAAELFPGGPECDTVKKAWTAVSVPAAGGEPACGGGGGPTPTAGPTPTGDPSPTGSAPPTAPAPTDDPSPTDSTPPPDATPTGSTPPGDEPTDPPSDGGGTAPDGDGTADGTATATAGADAAAAAAGG